ncbi:MAG: hypothetical protein WAW80_01530 [Candidatus Saccharimonadales bacterium]
MKNNKTKTVEIVARPTIDQTTVDLAIAMLIVSLVINLFFLVGWVTLKVTTAYDAEVAAALFIR